MLHGYSRIHQGFSPEDRIRREDRIRGRPKGRQPTAEYLQLLGWSLFVTNCTGEELTWKAVVVLYRARWQVELLFKLWKSHNRLAAHREGAPALEVLAVFYAKLLGVVLQHWVLVATAWQVAGFAGTLTSGISSSGVLPTR